MELRQYVMVVWKRWWLVVLTTALAGIAAAVVSFTTTPTYRATVRLEVDQGSDPAQDAFTAARSNEAAAGTYVVQVESPTVMEAVVARLQLNVDAKEVQNYVSASQVAGTSMIDINAEHTNPALAKALAETTAQVFIEQKEAQQQARYAASLTDLETQVDALEAEIMQTRGQMATLGDEADLGPTGRVELARLQTQLSNDQTRLSVMLQSTEQFRLAMARYGDYISVFSPAELPTDPVSPQPLRNIALARGGGRDDRGGHRLPSRLPRRHGAHA